jgi:hypothetical protein
MTAPDALIRAPKPTQIVAFAQAKIAIYHGTPKP